MPKRGTGSGGYRSTGSNRHRKRIWRFAIDPADKVHHPPPGGRRSDTHAIIAGAHMRVIIVVKDHPIMASPSEKWR
jgi:hypothetical protein